MADSPKPLLFCPKHMKELKEENLLSHQPCGEIFCQGCHMVLTVIDAVVHIQFPCSEIQQNRRIWICKKYKSLFPLLNLFCDHSTTHCQVLQGQVGQQSVIQYLSRREARQESQVEVPQPRRDVVGVLGESLLFILLQDDFINHRFPDGGYISGILSAPVRRIVASTTEQNEVQSVYQLCQAFFTEDEMANCILRGTKAGKTPLDEGRKKGLISESEMRWVGDGMGWVGGRRTEEGTDHNKSLKSSRTFCGMTPKGPDRSDQGLQVLSDLFGNFVALVFEEKLGKSRALGSAKSIVPGQLAALRVQVVKKRTKMDKLAGAKPSKRKRELSPLASGCQPPTKMTKDSGASNGLCVVTEASAQPSAVIHVEAFSACPSRRILNGGTSNVVPGGSCTLPRAGAMSSSTRVVQRSAQPLAWHSLPSPCAASSPLTPQTSTPAPQTSSFAPRTSSHVPQTSSHVPQTSSFVPQTSTLALQTLSLVPQTSSLVPQTSSLVPRIPGASAVHQGPVVGSPASYHVLQLETGVSGTSAVNGRSNAFHLEQVRIGKGRIFKLVPTTDPLAAGPPLTTPGSH
ncbi:unnamed protein product [Cyprideis torosa]|uniref:Uncharacterized protein n=1 Tax=Cyprideis torosa TaxID=163714 RepID=A0A7R8ZI32_9CRUS|nr:unnamed protein product [Cyprideis torosa]CAG0883906.1 unnamed protein product [Cyprideis torosa]